MMKTAVVLMALVVVSVKTQHCPEPAKQYSGLFSIILGQVSTGGKPTSFPITGTMSTDVDKMRAGGSQQITVGQYTVSQKFVADYKEQVSYVVTNGKCGKYPIPAYMDVKDGHYLGTFSYGSGKLMIESFMATVKPTPKYNGTTTVYIALDAETCIPVTSVNTGYFTKDGKTTYETSTFNLVNATSSIPDPNVLEIPSECK